MWKCECWILFAIPIVDFFAAEVIVPLVGAAVDYYRIRHYASAIMHVMLLLNLNNLPKPNHRKTDAWQEALKDCNFQYF